MKNQSGNIRTRSADDHKKSGPEAKKQQQQQQPAQQQKKQQQQVQKPISEKPQPQQQQTEDQWLQILIGSYHNAVQGYTFRLSRNAFLEKFAAETVNNSAIVTPASLLLKQPVIRFSGNQHTGCVYSVTCNGSSVVASSGSDERIALCSVKNHGTVATDLGSMLPGSTVRILSFVNSGGGHLVCGCDDGSLAIYRTRNWNCEAVLPVHKKSMISFAITNNGALCITLGQDRYLAFVDLMRGAIVHRHKFAPAIAKQKQQQQQLPSGEQPKEEVDPASLSLQQRFGFVNQPPSQVLLSPSGKTVVVVAPYYVAFFDLRTAQLVCTLEQEDPQPEIEHQAGAFVLVSPATATKKVWALVLSTEGGKMLACTEPEISTDVTASDSAEPVVVPAKWISVHEIASTPEEIRKMQLAQQKQSLYQVATNRIRSIASMGATCEGIVTASSSGEIRCWVARTVGSSTLQKIDLIECTIPIQVGGRVTCVSSSLI
jgi:WD40 repeat protein